MSFIDAIIQIAAAGLGVPIGGKRAFGVPSGVWRHTGFRAPHGGGQFRAAGRAERHRAAPACTGRDVRRGVGFRQGGHDAL